jgi:hypothetical protein
MWKHPYHRSNQEFEGWNLLLPQAAVLSCYAIATGLRIYIKTVVARWKWSATSGLKKLY